MLTDACPAVDAGAVAALSTAYRYPREYGSLLPQSGTFVFTDIGSDHGGGPAFEPVVKFVNRYRAAPRKVADRMFVSCGVYEPLIVPNRSMVPTFEAAGMDVRYVGARDGHGWENWRDRLREGLSWIFPARRSSGTSDAVKTVERWFSERLQREITVASHG